MYKCLNRGALRVQAEWEECLPLAKAAGFEGVDPELGADSSAAQVSDALAANDLRIGGAGLPVEFRADEETFKAGLESLKKIAPIAAAANCTRFATYILSFSDDLPFEENFSQHARRLGEAARVLDASGCRIGLEFLGPKTLRDGHDYEFIHTMDRMLELCAAVGSNAGLLLDAWHWYTSRSTVAALQALAPDQIVYVHINDAPRDVAIDDQIDDQRALHGDTGVIDLAGFCSALREIGYDGPVVPEPFINEFRDMDAGDVVDRAGKAYAGFWG